MKRKLFPILEYDKTRKAIINPSAFFDGKTIPENVVLCFFKDVIRELRVKHRIKEIACCRSEMGKHPIYELKIGKKCISVFHSAVGAPLAAGLFEELIALGGKKFIACGGAGVLDRNISAGHIMVPVSAVRDEGVSYHYLPPSREVRPSVKALKAIVNVLKNEKLSYLKCKTWTTDAPYRETPEKITLRKKEGCLSVEMEAASFFAVAKFRKVNFAQILYGGDDVSGAEWDSRHWSKHSAREKIFWLAVKACLLL